MTYIVDSLNELINRRIREVIEDICSNNPELNGEELQKKYCSENIMQTKTKKKKKNSAPSQECRCMAKKADGFQCTRRRKDGREYCGKHIGKIKFGRIDDDEKHKGSDYIKTHRELIDGEYYLVDDNNIVYSYNQQNPVILGKKVKDELILTKDIAAI